MYSISYTEQAIEDLQSFKKREQNVILDGVEQQLRYEPTKETRNRKRTRPNETAQWELRLGDFRVLYNVDDQIRIVEIQRIGEKQRDAFFFRGKRGAL
jgi:mRNA-degrading endonuclease RelE of RelBE toxin-antitoxin system